MSLMFSGARGAAAAAVFGFRRMDADPADPVDPSQDHRGELPLLRSCLNLGQNLQLLQVEHRPPAVNDYYCCVTGADKRGQQFIFGLPILPP